MRYILSLYVVLAVGNPAWTSEISTSAGGAEYQTPAPTTSSAAIPAIGAPTLPVASPAGAYQSVMTQPAATMPAATTVAPTTTTMSPGTYTVGTQPGVAYTMQLPNQGYTTNSYPTQMGGGLFGRRVQMAPYYTGPATTTYATPVQNGYTVSPGQTYYQPVRQRFGLFRRWRQQATPGYYSTSGYGTPMYTTSGYSTPSYAPYGYSTPSYYATTYASPAAMVPANTTMTPASPMTGTSSPSYTPTMMTVPNGTPAGATAASVEPGLQGTAPAETTPNPPGAIQGSPSVVPVVPQRRPR